MVKYTLKKCSCMLKPCLFWAKCLKIVEQCCLNWIIFHGIFYCYVQYSNIEYQDEIFKLIVKSTYEKVMANYGFKCRFRDLKQIMNNLMYFYHILNKI